MKYLITALMVLCFMGIAWGSDDAENLAVADTAVALSNATDGFQSAFCTVTGAPIVFRVDGGTPTATVGHYVATYGSITMGVEDIRKFKAIRQGAVSAVVFCSYYK